eukprot:6128803-Prymnesium_polylepis.3
MALARVLLLGCVALAAAQAEAEPEEWIESYDKASNRKCVKPILLFCEDARVCVGGARGRQDPVPGRLVLQRQGEAGEQQQRDGAARAAAANCAALGRPCLLLPPGVQGGAGRHAQNHEGEARPLSEASLHKGWRQELPARAQQALARRQGRPLRKLVIGLPLGALPTRRGCCRRCLAASGEHPHTRETGARDGEKCRGDGSIA